MSKHATHHHDHSHDHSCAHAHDHAGRAPEAIRAAELWCQEHGLRLTPIRRQALEALYATHQPLSAYDMIDKMVAAGAKRLAPISANRCPSSPNRMVSPRACALSNAGAPAPIAVTRQRLPDDC